MTMLDELIEMNTHYECGMYCCYPVEVKEIMKEYAECYAKKCLEIASDTATIYHDVGGYSYIDQQSILNIELPDHDSI